MLYYAAAVLAASVVLGQVEAQDQKDDFEKLRGLIGTWESPAAEQYGPMTRTHVMWRPILQGRFLEHQYMRLDADMKCSQWGMVICGQVPSDGKVRGWGFNPRGGLMPMTLAKWEGNTSYWAAEAILPSGTTHIPRIAER